MARRRDVVEVDELHLRRVGDLVEEAVAARAEPPRRVRLRPVDRREQPREALLQGLLL